MATLVTTTARTAIVNTAYVSAPGYTAVPLKRHDHCQWLQHLSADRHEELETSMSLRAGAKQISFCKRRLLRRLSLPGQGEGGYPEARFVSFRGRRPRDLVCKKGSKVMVTSGEDGYELWLRYRQVDNSERLAQYRQAIWSRSSARQGATVEIIKLS